MLLRNKTAVIYGAGGAEGSAVAQAFASQGAKVFLTGRHIDSVQAVAETIITSGGKAEAAQVVGIPFTADLGANRVRIEA